MRTIPRGQRANRWWVYVVPKGENLYVGITTDPLNRLNQHGRPASYYLKGPISRKDAVKLEKRLKRLSRLEKRDLLSKSSRHL